MQLYWCDRRASIPGFGGRLLHVKQVVLVRVHQRLPARVDDIAGHANGAEEFLRPVGRIPPALDHRADLRRRLVVRIDDADLVIDEVDAGYGGEEGGAW